MALIASIVYVLLAASATVVLVSRKTSCKVRLVALTVLLALVGMFPLYHQLTGADWQTFSAISLLALVPASTLLLVEMDENAEDWEDAYLIRHSLKDD